MYCTKCGQQFDEDSSFCGSCGQSKPKDSGNENVEDIVDEIADVSGAISCETQKQSANPIEKIPRKFSPPVYQQTFLADLKAELLPFLQGHIFGDRVAIETMDLRGDPYTVLVGDTTNHHAYLKVKFPNGYPLLGEPPQFSFITGTSLDQATAFNIQRKMQISPGKFDFNNICSVKYLLFPYNVLYEGLSFSSIGFYFFLTGFSSYLVSSIFDLIFSK